VGSIAASRAAAPPAGSTRARQAVEAVAIATRIPPAVGSF
jgi:hypothetical protein